jgi:hypothetical protein
VTIIATGHGLVDRRGDQVVGLPAGQLARRDAQGVEHLAHEAHLLAERIRCGISVCLVGLVGGVAERRLRAVERDEHVVGALLLQHVDEHRREPEHGIGDLAARRGHVRGQREERPVGQGVAVEEQQLAHALRVRARAIDPKPQ